MTQRSHPTSISYRPLPHKPHSIVADYPPEFSEAKRKFMRWHRHERPEGERGRCDHCRRTEEEVRRAGEGETNCSHVDHNPDDLHAFQPLCPRCHRANDIVQQSCAAALTMICEHRMVRERLVVRWRDLRDAVQRLGLAGATPGGADLTVVVCLHGHPSGSSESELTQAFREALGGLLGESEGDVRAVVRAAIRRLNMRRVPIISGEEITTGGGLVYYAGGRFRLRHEGPLTMPPDVTTPPPSLWAAADQAYRLSRRNSAQSRR